MKQLTLTQPWATLVAIGAKRIETRSWRTDYRGPLAIHAAKTLNGIFRGAGPSDLAAICKQEPFSSALAPLAEDVPDDEAWQLPAWALEGSARRLSLPMGQIIAVVDLADVLPTVDPDYPLTWERLPPEKIAMRFHRSPDERRFGNYEPGRYGWLLDNVRALPEPIETRGYQSLVDVDRQTVRMIRQQFETVEAAS